MGGRQRRRRLPTSSAFGGARSGELRIQGSGNQSTDKSKNAMARDLPGWQFGVCVRDIGGGHGDRLISFTDRTGSSGGTSCSGATRAAALPLQSSSSIHRCDVSGNGICTPHSRRILAPVYIIETTGVVAAQQAIARIDSVLFASQIDARYNITDSAFAIAPHPICLHT